jgi:hypothetical protein
VRVTDIRGHLVAAAAVVHGQFAFRDKPGGVNTIAVEGKDGAEMRKLFVP